MRAVFATALILLALVCLAEARPAFQGGDLKRKERGFVKKGGWGKKTTTLGSSAATGVTSTGSFQSDKKFDVDKGKRKVTLAASKVKAVGKPAAAKAASRARVDSDGASSVSGAAARATSGAAVAQTAGVAITKKEAAATSAHVAVKGSGHGRAKSTASKHGGVAASATAKSDGGSVVAKAAAIKVGTSKNHA